VQSNRTRRAPQVAAGGAGIARPVVDSAPKEDRMATRKQRTAARRNIKRAASAAKRKQTLKHLPKRTRRALGKEAAKARRRAA
jgi:hypothetical protein